MRFRYCSVLGKSVKKASQNTLGQHNYVMSLILYVYLRCHWCYCFLHCVLYCFWLTSPQCSSTTPALLLMLQWATWWPHAKSYPHIHEQDTWSPSLGETTHSQPGVPTIHCILASDLEVLTVILTTSQSATNWMYCSLSKLMSPNAITKNIYIRWLNDYSLWWS